MTWLPITIFFFTLSCLLAATVLVDPTQTLSTQHSPTLAMRWEGFTCCCCCFAKSFKFTHLPLSQCKNTCVCLLISQHPWERSVPAMTRTFRPDIEWSRSVKSGCVGKMLILPKRKKQNKTKQYFIYLFIHLFKSINGSAEFHSVQSHKVTNWMRKWKPPFHLLDCVQWFWINSE